jgi:hypothetical protein
MASTLTSTTEGDWYPFARLHGLLSQKTTIHIFVAFKPSYFRSHIIDLQSHSSRIYSTNVKVLPENKDFVSDMN